MNSSIFFSICIPAYKRPENIERLLNSISSQTFKDFEVIISDDSPDNSVQSVLKDFSNLPIKYFKNKPALGTPANWNFGISKAQGEWIKLMHDDDWFANKDSLRFFAEETKNGKHFIFSRYTNIFETGKTSQPPFPFSWRKKIINNPVTLLAKNVIGPPSVTLIHHSIKDQYDTFMKWRVDIDFYIRILKKRKSYSVIERPLINVGISESQVTNDCINVPEVELPEGLLLLTKYGVSPLKNILVYDAWWRILRNVNIRTQEKLHSYTPYNRWPKAIDNMVRHESLVSSKLLKLGVISKLSMIASYLVNRKFLKD
jgi:glycosyltransferase involved in cell wall biosynthesis